MVVYFHNGTHQMIADLHERYMCSLESIEAQKVIIYVRISVILFTPLLSIALSSTFG